jgi:catechol-2,3-dioxygenase
MPAPIKLAHLVFRTNQLHRMVDWYCTVLSASVVHMDAGLAFLAYDSEHHRIAIIANEEFAAKPAGKVVGFYHVAFTYGSLSELIDTYVELSGKEIRPTRTINHGPTISFYYHDPDLNEVELQVDCFGSAEEGREFMEGSAFANNPIGILVDPEVIRRDLQRGVPIEQLLRRADDVSSD